MKKSSTLTPLFLAMMLSGFSEAGYCQENGSAAVAQQGTVKVTGTVIDKKTSEAVSFATVLVANSTTGTNTDARGRFSLDVPVGSQLEVSFVGYVTQRFTITKTSDLTITLDPDSKTLNQVVVVGYGTQRRKDLSTAVSSVSGAELAKQPVLTLTQALQGKAAGVQIIGSGNPGEQPRMVVRGVGTLSADNGSNGTSNIFVGGGGVLYVVDGVLTNNITNIASSDIESVDILKDASAAAIYGSRGANGVVIITTKRGITNAPMQVSYNSSIGFKTITNKVKMANAAEYSNYYQAATGQIPATNQQPANTDWYGQVLRTGIQQNQNISVSGGGAKSTYMLSLGYFDDQGIIKGSDYKRYTVRINNDYNITKDVKIGVDANFAHGNNQEVNLSSIYNDAYRAAPIIPAMVGSKYGNTSTWGNVGNPLLDIDGSNHRVLSDRLQATGFLQARLIEGLTFRSSISGDYGTFTDRNYIYQYLNDTSTFNVAGGNQQSKQSELDITKGNYLHWVWDNVLTYRKSLKRHNFTVMLGTSAEQSSYSDITASRKNVAPDPSLWFIDQGDPNTATNNGGGIDFYRRAAYFGRFNYGYKDRYLLAATLRYDGSSRVAPENHWQYYPSVSGAWVISKEEFMQSQHIFSNLKLRAGYGEVGSEALPADAAFSSLASSSYPYTGGTATIGSQIPQIVYKNLNWERTKEASGGIDFGLLKDRLSGEVNYYDKRVNNALVYVPVQATTGDKNSLIYQNIGEIQNKGWEFALNWNGKIKKGWTYRISGNVTFNQNKVLSLNGGQAIQGGSDVMGYVTQTDNGQPIGSYYLLNVVGVFQSQADIDNYKNASGKVIQPYAHPGDFKYQDVNGDGVIDDKDKIYAGSYQPKAYFGLSLGTSYKGFDLSIDLYGNFGNKVYNAKRANRISGTDNIEASIAYDRWTPGSGINDQPAANTGNLPNSTYFLESGDFVRVNNISIGYTVPDKLAKRIHGSNLRVYVTAQNLFTWKKYSGFTAELPGTSALDAGLEQNAYPTSRVIAIGVNTNFK